MRRWLARASPPSDAVVPRKRPAQPAVARTRDPYAVLVSEVMLQQTQVERVVPYYESWLVRWPTAAALAAAPVSEAIRAWSGLGYNRRAVALHAAAGELARMTPRQAIDAAQLRRLPGIGPYTANAVACFAGGRQVPVVETNIARVIARAGLRAARPAEAGAHAIRRTAQAWLPPRGARDHNLALMDLGALVCRPRPDCPSCPLAPGCTWRLAGQPSAPVRTGNGPAARFEETARFARGRIVAALRTAPAGLGQAELAAMLPPAHAARLGTYLEALARDGRWQSAGGVWRLPGS